MLCPILTQARSLRRSLSPLIFIHHLTRTNTNTMVDKLDDLPQITKVSENVTRVLGQNPGKFTLQGTNTYIIGTQKPFILVDTAEGKDEYIPILNEALTSLSSSSSSTSPEIPDISDIIISHWHGDHVGGLPSVLTLLHQRWESRNNTNTNTNNNSTYPAPRLHKYPIPTNDKSHASTSYNKLPTIISSLPPNSFQPSPTGNPFHDLTDYQLFQSSYSSSISHPKLRILHTPGHTIDSISLEIINDQALYTADTVLGHGTSVFEDLSLYLQSLNKMLTHGDEEDPLSYQTIYPAHGPVVKSGRELITTYIKHRLEREQQIIQVLNKPPTEGDNWTTWSIVKLLYAAYPENLLLPASHSIQLHLTKLEGEGVIERVGGEGKDSAWSLLVRTPSPSL